MKSISLIVRASSSQELARRVGIRMIQHTSIHSFYPHTQNAVAMSRNTLGEHCVHTVLDTRQHRQLYRKTQSRYSNPPEAFAQAHRVGLVLGLELLYGVVDEELGVELVRYESFQARALGSGSGEGELLELVELVDVAQAPHDRPVHEADRVVVLGVQGHPLLRHPLD